MTETKAQQECPYCHGELPAMLIHGDDMYVGIEFREVVALEVSSDYTNDSYSTEINYCPKCGRKLEAE